MSREVRYYGLFNDSFPPIIDGVTLTVQNYATWLASNGRTPCVVTPWNPVKYPADYRVMRYFSLPILNRQPYRYGYPKADLMIWRRLASTPFVIAHSHCPFSSGRLAVYVARRQKIPLIGTFHSKYRSDLQHSFRHTPWMVPIIMKRILSFFNACDEVWIPQAKVAETAREYGFRGKLTVVENGNDFHAPPPDRLQDIKKRARSRLGYDDRILSLLFVGQHIWEKGIGVIAEALAFLRDAGVAFRMNFIGTGYALDGLRRKIAESGLQSCVTVHGGINDRELLSTYYAASDLFLFPSLYDNAPLVVREAAAMGTPAILTDGSTAAEVITDGCNGFLAAGTPQQFARRIADLETDRQAIVGAGERASQSLFRSWENVMAEVSDRYDSAVRNYNKNH